MNALCVIAAACLTGQTMEPQPVQPAPTDAPAQVQQEPHYLFPRLHALLHPAAKSCPCADKAPVAVPVPPQPVHAIDQVHAVEHVTKAAVTVPTTIQKRYQDKVGHEDNYSWITGQLFHIDAEGGRWVVRYATSDTEDRFHGNVVLPPDVNMKNFRAGDLVSVQGEIVNNGISSRVGDAPYYKVSAIHIIERVD